MSFALGSEVGNIHNGAIGVIVSTEPFQVLVGDKYTDAIPGDWITLRVLRRGDWVKVQGGGHDQKVGQIFWVSDEMVGITFNRKKVGIKFPDACYMSPSCCVHITDHKQIPR